MAPLSSTAPIASSDCQGPGASVRGRRRDRRREGPQSFEPSAPHHAARPERTDAGRDTTQTTEEQHRSFFAVFEAHDRPLLEKPQADNHMRNVNTAGCRIPRHSCWRGDCIVKGAPSLAWNIRSRLRRPSQRPIGLRDLRVPRDAVRPCASADAFPTVRRRFRFTSRCAATRQPVVGVEREFLRWCPILRREGNP
jgi:hypothetical protein